MMLIPNTRVIAPVVHAEVSRASWIQQLNEFLTHDADLKGAIAGISIREAERESLFIVIMEISE